ncbi:DUF723 domain-containing protein [Vibrio jasicida]|uniref:DUF723 domain-containing protein n=1 Tax=Vibrio jasicida TaxID=766224 RepID=UPI0011B05B85|nr:DUF723 domain-containing protein [Vibrio jasicida]
MAANHPATQVKVICPKHGAFHTSSKNFLAAVKKIGCPSCRRSQGGTKQHQNLLLKVFV